MGSVLIIDADDGFSNDLVSVLNARGLDVQVTPDGKAGLDLARINIPDAIVLCVELPRMSGYSICAKLKKDTTLKTVPLIITSAEATQETFEHHKKLKTRAEEYMKKPFAPEELVHVLSSYVSMSNGAGAGHGPISEELPIEEDVEPQTLNDEEVFAAEESDGMMSIDQEIQNLKKQKLPPQELPEATGLNESFDEEEGMTTVAGAIGHEEWQAANAEIEKQALEIEKLRSQITAEKESRSKAERERDLAVANEKASAAQLAKMMSSQPPTAASSGREALELKKQLNSKDREVLELKDRLSDKEKELLAFRDKEMEYEGKIVEAQEAQAASEQEKNQLEAKLAAVEARLYETERSSSAKTEDLNRQLAELNTQAADLDGTVQSLTQELAEAVEDNESLTAKNQELQAKIGQLTNELNASRSEANNLRTQLGEAKESISELEDRNNSLRVSVEAANQEVRELRSTIEETEDRLSRAYQKIREDEDVKSKAKKALEIASALLVEAGFSADGEPSEDIDKIAAG
jgi:DNA-binding response OmpR family regulator/predicted  nucleic acid-binding Zn-ribbon protein